MQKEYEKKSFKSEINGNTTQRPTWLIYSFTSSRIYVLFNRTFRGPFSEPIFCCREIRERNILNCIRFIVNIDHFNKIVLFPRIILKD